MKSSASPKELDSSSQNTAGRGTVQSEGADLSWLRQLSSLQPVGKGCCRDSVCSLGVERGRLRGGQSGTDVITEKETPFLHSKPPGGLQTFVPTVDTTAQFLESIWSPMMLLHEVRTRSASFPHPSTWQQTLTHLLSETHLVFTELPVFQSKPLSVFFIAQPVLNLRVT